MYRVRTKNFAYCQYRRYSVRTEEPDKVTEYSSRLPVLVTYNPAYTGMNIPYS